MTIWQIAAGEHQREYSEEFLSRGMAFVGGAPNSKSLGQVKAGDLLVLKRGLSEVLAVGRVIERDGRHGCCGDKQWLKDFDGWDLGAYVFVDWRRPPHPLPTQFLNMGAIKRILKSENHLVIQDAFTKGAAIEPNKQDPDPTRAVSESEILDHLIAHGFSETQASHFSASFSRIRELARYYREECNSKDVREHEARTFLVVPLLLALGWTEKQIKIELNVPDGRLDLACFRRPYVRNGRKTNDEDCELIIETKGLRQGLSLAPAQARRYAESFPSTRAVIVTNGYCYKVFAKTDGAFTEHPTSYLNLLNLRDRYPLDPVRTAGCSDAIQCLAPQQS